ncbi:hypothetical protein [Nonomuraea sp. NPDC050786]|uniref:hypothetical protein n=1 Tax=Nonomuraea sp. NPDC050786 TaxID=3154840 RepID=UPI0033C5275A
MRLRAMVFAAIGALPMLVGAAAAPALELELEPAGGRSQDPRTPGGTIGIRLLEASANRRDDPRARIYIVDHINPGTTISRRFEVLNTSGSPQTVTVYPDAAEIRGNRFVPAARPDANELSSWVSVERRQVLVPAHGAVPLKATISIPAWASKGERYGAIWAETASRLEPGSKRSVQTATKVGIRLYLDVGPGGDPPSDFRIERLTPARTQDGRPVVTATVRNTGERALDLSGWMRLSEGPGGLGAGPFRAQAGTTLAPGGSGSVAVVLDGRLPDGPWRVEFTLESGRVRRTVTGTLAFPTRSASWGAPALLDSSTPWGLIAAGLLAAAALAITAVLAVRRRAQRHSNLR